MTTAARRADPPARQQQQPDTEPIVLDPADSWREWRTRFHEEADQRIAVASMWRRSREEVAALRQMVADRDTEIAALREQLAAAAAPPVDLPDGTPPPDGAT